MLEGLLETWVPGFQQQQLLEAWGDVVDMLDLRNDERLLIGNYMSGGTVQDRKDGRNLPIFQNDQDLASIRANARLICDVVPTAIGALKHLKNYIIHTGMTYRVVSEDGVKVDPGLIRAAQRVIDKFQDRHDWRGDLENELFIRSRRDGEFCLRFWFQNDGTTDVRPVEPEQIHDDGRTEEGRSFSFGVDSPSTDVCRADGYLIEDSAGHFDYVPADEIELMKLNVDRTIKRGISDFFSIRSHLEDSEKLNRNVRLGAAVAAAIAYVIENASGTTESQASSLRSAKATRTYPRQTAGGSTTGYQRKIQPGTILDMSAGRKYLAGPLSTIKSEVLTEIEQSVLRKVAVRFGMPEHMVSGMGTGEAFASSIVHESPFVRECEAEQVRYVTRFRRIHWKVIQHAADCGLFKQWGIYGRLELEDVLDLVVTAPSVVTRNRLAEAQADDLEQAAGILSDRTRASEAGRDYDLEVKQGAKKAQPPAQPGMAPDVPNPLGAAP